jgi:hypothetical protein
MHYQVIYQAEHQVVLVVQAIILNNRNKIHELIVVVDQCPMDEVLHEAEVDVIIRMDQIVAIIIIIIQMIMVRMEMVVMKHLYHHHHGLVVVINHAVHHSEIEYDLMMIGK